MQDVRAYYEDLFRDVVADLGELDGATPTSIIGFSAGGPVSLCRVATGGAYVTCELSLYPEQQVSSEGLKFELLYRGGLSEAAVRKLLTAIGNLSMDAKLGDCHTIDVTPVMREYDIQLVRLNLFSRSDLQSEHGIYEVIVTEPTGA